MALLPIERDALLRFRKGLSGFSDAGPDRHDLDENAWISFTLRALLDASRRVRAATPVLQELKADGSPATELEHDIEVVIRDALRDLAPDAAFVGEETGGGMGSAEWAVSVDPIDGTWAFLTHTETFATVINVFRDGAPFLGVVGSPRTGEIGYAVAGGRTRLLRVDLLGGGDGALTLPLADRDPTKVLVNVHPARSGASVMAALIEAWERSDVRMVRAPGGSPSWAMLEAARGHFTYLNRWSEAGADPWDLAAGALLVRGAGGEVVDLDERPIDPVGHRGPFVAGVEPSHRARVVEIARRALQG